MNNTTTVYLIMERDIIRVATLNRSLAEKISEAFSYLGLEIKEEKLIENGIKFNI